jgi:glycosyltransferase involved in cell wall biosynthesis
MRILNIICSTDPAGGGPIEWVRQFGLVASREGHHVEVASLDPPDKPWMDEFPLPLHALGYQLNNFYSRDFVPWLRAAAGHYDCVIAHGLWRYASFGTWRAMHGKSVPYFVYTHGMLDPWFKRAYPLKHFGKWLYWPWADYRVLRDAAGVIFTCEQEKLKARESFWLYRAKEIVATLGISEPAHDFERSREAFRSRYPALQDGKFLLFLGRIHPKKGCDILIDAFASLAHESPDLKLVFAGPDQTNWVPRIKERSTKLNIQDRIIWAGMVSGETKWGAFNCADAFVLPSHQENFGIAVVEAMACGLPVLISDKVDIWREIQSDDAGLICDDTASGTELMLRKWVKLPDEEKKRFRSNAIHSFQTRFEITHAAHHLLTQIGTVVAP